VKVTGALVRPTPVCGKANGSAGLVNDRFGGSNCVDADNPDVWPVPVTV
jgi:hypothetical protein